MLFSWDLLIQGFGTAISPENLLWALLGCFIGTLVGVLPGIGPSSGIAILLPLTTVLDPVPAIIMLAAIYYGAMYGGSTTAIVVNIPGEASSVPTAMDGYQLAKQGRAGAALAISAISSFVAGTISLFGLTFFAPALATRPGLRPPGILRPHVHGAFPGHQPLGPRPPQGHHRRQRGAPGLAGGPEPPDRRQPAHLRFHRDDGRHQFHQRHHRALRHRRGAGQRGTAHHGDLRAQAQELDVHLARPQGHLEGHAPLLGGGLLPGPPAGVRAGGHHLRGLRH